MHHQLYSVVFENEYQEVWPEKSKGKLNEQLFAMNQINEHWTGTPKRGGKKYHA